MCNLYNIKPKKILNFTVKSFGILFVNFFVDFVFDSTSPI